MNLPTALRTLERRFAQAGLPSPRADAELLLEWVTGLEGSRLRLELGRELTREQETQLERAARRRLERYPLQLIVGRAWFYGLPLRVREGVLIPRPETEVLVSLSLERLPHGARVLDLGTGTGAIALALKHERPGLEVWATDLSETALELARSNALELGLDVHFRQGDLFSGVAGPFAALVSNPPYLPQADRAGRPLELETEPDTALYSGPDGLALARRLLRQAPAFLEPGGFVALELDPRNVRMLADEVEGGWSARVERDLAGRERFLTLERRG